MQPRRASRVVGNDRGSQIMEFAISLPLLVVLVVGIYDFAQAFNVKQKLNFAAKDGARLGAIQPTNDLSQPAPISVAAIRDLVDADLIAEGLQDCGLGASPLQPTGTSPVSWMATATCQTQNDLTLTIDRGFLTPPSSPSEPYLISTHVSISYPYRWHFTGAVQLVAPGASFAGPSPLTIDAVAANQD